MKTEEAREIRSGWLIDAHVHIYPCFDRDRFFDAAARNFKRAASVLGTGSSWRACLLLTETRRDHVFEELSGPSPISEMEWLIEPSAEPGCLVARREDEPALTVIAGRQIVTRERLEVLALGCTAMIDDGLPGTETVERALENSLAVVLPWGFGKWWFERRRVLDGILSSVRSDRLFVGDNGNRPRLMPSPRALDHAAELGIGMLPGSDPLPLDFHETRAGSCGVFLPCEPDAARPRHQLEQLLRAPYRQGEMFCTPEPMHRFLRSQVLMQWHKQASLQPNGRSS